MKLNGCSLATVLLALSGSLHAGQVVLDGSLGRSGPVSLNADNQFQITSDLGRQFGANLFHSFAQLNLSQGESAVFSGPSSIRNILARVTGGASAIDGTLKSEIPSANLFLLNSRGITFGPNASLEIGGAFYASTADYIALSDGNRFEGKTSSGTVLSAASPVAFGFLGSSPGSKLVCQGTLQDDSGISLIGGDIEVTGGNAQLKAAGGSIVLASMKSAGELLVDPAQVAASAAKFSQQGSIEISEGASVDATPSSGVAGGRVIIRGGKLTMEDATIRNDSQVGVSPDAPEIWGIDIEIAGDITFGDRAIVHTTANNTAGKASGISIAAANCALGLGSQVTADNSGGGAGPDLKISARGSLLDDGLIRDDNLSPSSGSGGSVSISSHDFQFNVDARGFFENYSSGQPPSLYVKADTMTFAASASYSIAAGSFSTGPGAALRFDVGKLTMEQGSEILVDTYGPGNAGTIGIFGQDAIIRGQLLAQANSLSGANSGREGAGGSITVHETGTLTLVGGAASISSSFLVDNGAGGGNVGLQARTIKITDGATVSAESRGKGNSDGGNVQLASTDFVVLNRAALVADARYGQGGNLTIEVPHFVKSVDSTINVSSTFGQSGKEDLPTESFDFATVLTGLNTVVGEQPAQWAEPMAWVSTDPGGYTFLGRRRQGETEQQRRMILER